MSVGQTERETWAWAKPSGPGVPGFTGYMGGADGVDHIYENCPILKRRHKRWGGSPQPLSDLLYPEDDPYNDICGWCKRQWRKRVESDA